MEISKGINGDIAILHLGGRLDLESSATLKAETNKILGEKYNKVILDLKGIDFINSSGLGALVSILKNVRSSQGNLKLAGLAPYVEEVFEITQLSSIFDIYANENSAIDSYKNLKEAAK